MPTLREFIAFVRAADGDMRDMERKVRQRWPETRVWIPRGSSAIVVRDSRRRDEIIETARSESVGVAATRFGLSRRHVRRLLNGK